MGNTDFSNRINKLIKEQVYGFGVKMTPVEKATWPDTSSDQEDIPSTNQSVVTSGDTTPLGEPRDDVAASNTGAQHSDPETMAEVSSLLITIGHILAKDGLVNDKFDTCGVIEFLNTKFKSNPLAQQELPVQQDNLPAVVPQPQADVMSPQTYMEERKLLESRFKK